jgi:tetratricopeptide (TPR) repeat protein
MFLTIILLRMLIPASVEDGDREFLRTNYKEAAAIYDSVLTAGRDSSVVLWRLARAYVCMADVAEEKDQLDLYRIAGWYAERSIVADSLIADGHTWRAAALGNIAMYEGGKTKIRLTHEIRNELDLAIRLNPSDDIAYSILGSFYIALGDVSWIERQLAAIFLGRLPEGGFPEAEQALRKAIALAPDVIRHHFELGRLYLLMGRDSDARTELQRVTTLRPSTGSDPRTQKSAERMILTITRDDE